MWHIRDKCVTAMSFSRVKICEARNAAVDVVKSVALICGKQSRTTAGVPTALGTLGSYCIIRILTIGAVTWTRYRRSSRWPH
jgi:hypothetical protein